MHQLAGNNVSVVFSTITCAVVLPAGSGVNLFSGAAAVMSALRPNLRNRGGRLDSEARLALR